MTSTSKRRGTTRKTLGPVGLADLRQSPVHPGSIFRHEYRQAGTDDEISQAECARRMGIPLNRLNEIEKGKRGISAETAWLLAALTGTTAELWMNLQTRYDLWHALQAIAPRLKKIERLRQT